MTGRQVVFSPCLFPLTDIPSNISFEKMVQTVTEEHTYKHPFETVTLAVWRKYPHPLLPQVYNVETLQRRVVPETMQLLSSRLFEGSTPVPSWAQWAINAKSYFCLEESVVDLQEKTMTMKLESITFSDIVKITETCTYSVHPENPNWTLFRQVWSCDWIYPPSLAGSLESICVDRFKNTVGKGRQAISMICEELDTSKGN